MFIPSLDVQLLHMSVLVLRDGFGINLLSTGPVAVWPGWHNPLERVPLLAATCIGAAGRHLYSLPPWNCHSLVDRRQYLTRRE